MFTQRDLIIKNYLNTTILFIMRKSKNRIPIQAGRRARVWLRGDIKRLTIIY